MTIVHIAHIARRMFLRNTADPDLQNFWIAQAKAIQEANSVTKYRTSPPMDPARGKVETS
jgi:hypothetical protein